MRRIVLALALAVFVTPAAAQTGIYTISGTGAGSLGGVPFTDVVFSLAIRDDLSNLLDPYPGLPDLSAFLSPSASIELAGIGDFSFVSPVRFFAVRSLTLIGLEESGSGGDIVYLEDPAFATYHLSTDVEPRAVTHLLGSTVVATTGGPLSLESASAVTFSASISTSTVPEPLSLVLLATGLAGVAAGRRRAGKRDEATRKP